MCWCPNAQNPCAGTIGRLVRVLAGSCTRTGWASLFLFAKFVELSHACCRLGDRSRPSPPSRDDAGDVAQSGRWLERAMVGIDNDGADATNNNGDNKQILSSSHNDDDIDDGDRSTYIQENMINEI